MLGKYHPQVKDLRVLAASSSAVALATASPSCILADDEPFEPALSTESSWKTAYEAARMAVELANASSDMFLPLKMVLDALSALAKNFDVSPPGGFNPIGF